MPKQKRGFTYVKSKGFISLREDIQSGARWKDINTSMYEDPSKPADIPLHKQPFPVKAKVRILRALGALLSALGAGLLDILDAAWDKTQRRFLLRVAFLLLDDDPQRQAAAQKIRRHPQLFLGDGTGQTNLPVRLEIDWGRQQIAILRSPEFAPLVALLELGEFVDEIERTTKELAQAVGRGEGEVADDTITRQKRIEIALKECRQACNSVLDDLNWLILQPEATLEDKKELEEMRAPLLALLERYVITVPDDEDDEESEEEEEDIEATDTE